MYKKYGKNLKEAKFVITVDVYFFELNYKLNRLMSVYHNPNREKQKNPSPTLNKFNNEFPINVSTTAVD